MSVAPEKIRFLTREEIEERASEMRRAAFADAVPVDPFVVAKRLGLSVRTAEFKDKSTAGMIWNSGDAWEIYVRDGDPVRRMIFTVAHELGHYALHLRDEGSGEYVDPDVHLYRLSDRPGGEGSVDRSREIQANMFAAALLMPESEVRRAWGRDPSIRGLARTFRVSELAMRYRIEQLGLW